MKTLPVPSVLLVLFVFCKLAGVTRIANWSWWWVLSPAWAGTLVVLAIVAVNVAAEARKGGLR